jgi:hypothetical protein
VSAKPAPDLARRFPTKRKMLARTWDTRALSLTWGGKRHSGH